VESKWNPNWKYEGWLMGPEWARKRYLHGVENGFEVARGGLRAKP